VLHLARFQVNWYPEYVTEYYRDGKRRGKEGLLDQGRGCIGIPAGEHEVEVVWPDGRRAAKKFYLKPGENKGIFLTPYDPVVNRQIVAGAGGHTYLFSDQQGRIWLLWDGEPEGRWYRYGSLSEELDLFCATSNDGLHWSAPRRLPVSSSALDMCPVLQQDRYGTYWLVWDSSRDPEERCRPWIASSQDGSKWTFPRKLVPPTDATPFAFTIDSRNTFWLISKGTLFRSLDASQWSQVEVLSTSGKPDDTWVGRGYFLTHDGRSQLLVLTSRWKLKLAVWRRTVRGRWQDLGTVCEDQANFGSVTADRSGRVGLVFSRNTGIFFRTYDEASGWSEKMMVEVYTNKPTHPSILHLEDGRYLVAYSCKDGIVAAVCELPSVDAEE